MHSAGTATSPVSRAGDQNIGRLLVVLLLFCTAAPARIVAETFDWAAVPAGRWVRVPTKGIPAPKVVHGGGTIAPERREVYFFGSDTHWPTDLEKGESNAFHRLNLDTLTWSQDYEQDPKSSYRIAANHQAETATGRPWAMHTFDAVVWDPTVQRVVVLSHPGHTRFEPEKRFLMFQGDWYKKLQPSHWEYDPANKRWSRLATNAPRLFTATMTWDPRRRQLIGHNGGATYHFDRKAGKWRTAEAATAPGWHLSTVYDIRAGRMLLLGNNKGSGDLLSYNPESQSWEQLTVKGTCLAANGAAIAFDTSNAVMMYLANDHPNQYHNPTGKAVTFLYHSKGRAWERLTIKSPPLYGMNYLMQYDPGHKVFLHFEKGPESGERIEVWAFRYR